MYYNKRVIFFMTKNKIIIKDTCNADGRTATDLNSETLFESTNEHRSNVKDGMEYIADLIRNRGLKHDYTKIGDYFPLFNDTVMQGLSNDEFEKSQWKQLHLHQERHHLNGNAPADVNLIDVIEMLVDVVMAGNGRSGHLSSRYCKIQDPTLLERAYWNTILLLDDKIEKVDKK